jgi:hypothetical protein
VLFFRFFCCLFVHLSNARGAHGASCRAWQRRRQVVAGSGQLTPPRSSWPPPRMPLSPDNRDVLDPGICGADIIHAGVPDLTRRGDARRGHAADRAGGSRGPGPGQGHAGWWCMARAGEPHARRWPRTARARPHRRLGTCRPNRAGISFRNTQTRKPRYDLILIYSWPLSGSRAHAWGEMTRTGRARADGRTDGQRTGEPFRPDGAHFIACLSRLSPTMSRLIRMCGDSPTPSGVTFSCFGFRRADSAAAHRHVLLLRLADGAGAPQASGYWPAGEGAAVSLGHGR